MKVFRQSALLEILEEEDHETASSLTEALARPLWPRLLFGSAVVLMAIFLAVAVGPVGVPLDAVGKVIFSRLFGLDLADSVPKAWDSIVWQVRLPRVLLAGLVGAILAMAGATYQGVFRNPLAEPYLIGVATGAALGAVIVIVSGFDYIFIGFSLLPLAAFAGALISVALAYSFARVGNKVPVTSLILAGVALASLSTAITSFLMMRSTTSAFSILSVILGGFNLSSWSNLIWVLPYFVPALVVILIHGRILNVLQLDEDQAQQLGVNVERVRLLLLAAASLAAAAAVSVSGTIGFVGLIVPHAVRLLWGSDHRQLLPLSMLLGAGFLILADLLARMVIQPSEVPVGIITAFCGVPFFLFLLRRSQSGVYR